MGILTSSEDPNEMQYGAAFHQGLHYTTSEYPVKMQHDAAFHQGLDC